MQPILTLGDITPEWLSNVLSKKVRSITATGIGTGQVGATYRLMLEGEGVPKTLVAKLPSNDELSRTTGKSHLTYLCESRFYQQFAGRKPMAVPDHLYIAFDEDSHDFTLLMRDLPLHRAGNQLSEPSEAEAMAAMDAAAGIHAGWWGDPMLDTLDWLNGTHAVPPPLDVDALYAMFWPAFCDRYGDEVTNEMRVVGDLFVGKIAAHLNLRAGPRCLTHNDFRPDNMLFNLADVANPVVIVDWQTVGVGIGIGDIAYFTGTSFEPEARRALEPSLMARYRQALLSRDISERDLVGLGDDYARSAVSGFLMGVTASMVVERTDRGDAMFLAMARRSAAMVLDHRELTLPD